MGFPTNDDQWEEKQITEVRDWGDRGWELKFGSLCLAAPNGPIELKSGMTVRLYGTGGLGGFVRGIFVEGHLFRYETADEMRQRYEGESAKKEREDQERLEAEIADRDARWALEEGLAGGLAVVVGEVGAVTLTESRRLQLAAEAAGATALLLRPRAAAAAPGAALTRWRLAALPGAVEPGMPGVGRARWRAELFRCRGGAAATWEMEWRDETGDLALAAPLRDRPDRTQPARLAG